MKKLFFVIACIPALALAQGQGAPAVNPTLQLLVGNQNAEAGKAASAAQQNDAVDFRVEPKSNGKTVDDFYGNRDPFFPKDSAATTFAKETTLGDSLSMGTFDDTAGKRTKPTPQAASDKNAKSDFVDGKFKNPYPKDKEGIVSAFGDPSEDTPLKAIDNAPTPFKAMMASIQAGDSELAFAYARQYVRYMKGVQGSMKAVDKMTNAAMQMEGMAEPSEDESVDDPEFKKLMNKDLEKVRGQSDDGLYIAKMNPAVQEMLERAEAAEQHGAPRATPSADREKQFPSGYEPGFDEVKERVKVRRSIMGRVPVDTAGKVNVYVQWSVLLSSVVFTLKLATESFAG